MNDLRFAVRQILRKPGFTLVAVLVLALGTGVNATIFSVINSVLLKPVNAREPGRLVGLYQRERDIPDGFRFFSYPDYLDLRSVSDSLFTDLIAVAGAQAGLQGEFTQRVPVQAVSGNFFRALGVEPLLGRAILPEEEASGTPVAVLGYPLWLSLGGDRSVIGTKLRLARTEVTVVGVMPRGFSGATVRDPGLFVPLAMLDELLSMPGQGRPVIRDNRLYRQLMLIGRLKPGVSLSGAAAPLANVNRQFEIADPAEPKPRTLVCAPLPRFGVSDRPTPAASGLAPMAGFALGLSTLVLCVACLNLANMMLARGTARRKEIAVRLAVGAGRGRILRQLLAEGFLLALLGSAAGLLVSLWANRLIAAFIYSGAGMGGEVPEFDLAPDWRVFLTLASLSGLATLFFALGPAWRLAHMDVNSDLKVSPGEDAGGFKLVRLGVRELLAVAQMAVALALLVAAGLFSRSAMKAAAATPGFEFGSNFYFTINPALGDLPEPELRAAAHRGLARLAILPGVESVSLAMNIPFGDNWWERPVQRGGEFPGSLPGSPAGEPGGETAMYNVVGGDYFRTLGIPLLQGREFERQEVEGSNAPPVAIISQNLAEKLWPGTNPLGRVIQFPGYRPDSRGQGMTVVGVVPALHWRLFEKSLPGSVYVPCGQELLQTLRIHVRVAPGGNPAALIREARAELQRIEPLLPVTEVKTLEAMHRDGPLVRIVRLGSYLFGAFGGLALLLSVLGIYGLKSYSVARRTREVGIRMALGVGKLAANFLYGVPPADPLTFALIVPVLLLAALAASFGPARRAAKVDPMAALRQE